MVVLVPKNGSGSCPGCSPPISKIGRCPKETLDTLWVKCAKIKEGGMMYVEKEVKQKCLKFLMPKSNFYMIHFHTKPFSNSSPSSWKQMQFAYCVITGREQPKEKNWASPHKRRERNKGKKNFFCKFYSFFTQVQIWSLSMPLSVTVFSSLFYSVVLYVQGEDNRKTAGTQCPLKCLFFRSVFFKNTSLLVGDVQYLRADAVCFLSLFCSQLKDIHV